MKWMMGAALALGLLCAAPASAAVIIVVGGQATGVNAVTVGSTTYNVTFAEGTCAGLFGGCDSLSDFTFQTQADAQAAGAALLAAIVGSSFDTDPGTTFGCIGAENCSMLIPFSLGNLGFEAVSALNGSAVNSTAVVLSASTTTFDTGTSITRVWALFGPATAVPEPSTWAMMLLGFAGIGLAMRRRRKRAALA